MSAARELVERSAEAGRLVLDHVLGDGRSVIDPSRTIWTEEVAIRVSKALKAHLTLRLRNRSQWEWFRQQLQRESPEVVLFLAESAYLREAALAAAPAAKVRVVEQLIEVLPGPLAVPSVMVEAVQDTRLIREGAGWFYQAIDGFWKWMSTFVLLWSTQPEEALASYRADPWRLRQEMATVPMATSRARNTLLFYAYPDVFEPTATDEAKRKIRDAFLYILDGSYGSDNEAVDRDLQAIRTKLEAGAEDRVDYYTEPWASRWSSSESAGKRAWAVRVKPAGRELLERWLLKGFVSLAGAHLQVLPAGSSKGEVHKAIDDGYEHVDYAQRLDLTEDHYAFLSRMSEGDIVVARHEGDAWVGRIASAPEFVPSEPRLRRSVVWEQEPIEVGTLPAPVPNLMRTPSRNVIDLTDALDDLEKLFPGNDAEVDVPQMTAGEYETNSPSGTVKPVLRRATDELARLLHIGKEWLDEYIGLLEARQQVIVHGPPGTGKTYLAHRIAKYIAGDEAVRLVQFHPSYAYEDFFEGFRPRGQDDGSLTFDKVPGPLRRIAAEAKADSGSPYVLIIDEINRGNLPKVFGELYFLLEYRDENISLQYSPDEQFTLPKNLFIIGTMNTADRSIAMVDAAIRRRFSFVEMHPDVDPVRGLLRRWLTASERDGHRAELLHALNREIGAEDRDFKVGPSYLMRAEADTDDGLVRIWRHDILPLLEEHYYGRLTRDQVAASFGLEALRRRIGPEVSDAEGAVQDQGDGPASGI